MNRQSSRSRCGAGAARRGFSLIELLVVISVVSVLISLSVPSFSRGRLAAKRARCMANLRSIGQGMEAYLWGSGHVYPVAAGYPIRAEDRAEYCAALPEPPPEEGDADFDEGCLYAPIYVALGTEIGHQQRVFQCPADRIVEEIEDRPNRGTYYESVGSSYEWAGKWANGKRRGHTAFTAPDDSRPGQERGMGMAASEGPLLWDFEAYHGGEDETGSVVTLFEDMHVSTDEWVEPVAETPEVPDPG